MAGVRIRNSSVLKHFVDNHFKITCRCCVWQSSHNNGRNEDNPGSQKFAKNSHSSQKIVFRNETKFEGHSASPLPRRMVMSEVESCRVDGDASSKQFSFSYKSTLLMIIGATLVHFLAPVLFPRATPIVRLQDGSQVQGIWGYSRGSREYWQFLSIPYAEPPLGKLRWQPPVKKGSWEGVLQARSFPPYCLQFETVVTQTVFGTEDCLFLNVFAPPFKNGTGGRGSPVLVHFHGGGFLCGGSRLHHPDYFMDHDLVVVTLNYRLGPFGFLNFDHDSSTDDVPLPRGNMGMKDQNLALQWIQANIASFGGDPSRVTLIGESAGGVSVHAHLFSPKSKGLFHRAISHSGSIFSPWGFTNNPRKLALRFASQLKCPTSNSSALFSCLQDYNPRELVRFQLSSTDPAILKDNISPSIESVITDDTFLHAHPNEILKRPEYLQSMRKIPYMFGVNSGEGALRTGRYEALPHTIATLYSNWTESLENALLFDNLPQSAAEQARAFYFKSYDNYSNLTIQQFLDTVTSMFSDVLAYEPVQRAGTIHAKNGGQAYMYFYNYKPNFFPGLYSFFRACTPRDWLPKHVKIAVVVALDWVKEHVFGEKGAHLYGVVHGEDVFQLWNPEGVTKYFSLGETEFSESYVKMIANFVSGTSDVNYRGVAWPPIAFLESGNMTNAPVPYMLLDNSGVGKIVPEPFAERVRFWNNVGITTFN